MNTYMVTIQSSVVKANDIDIICYLQSGKLPAGYGVSERAPEHPACDWSGGLR